MSSTNSNPGSPTDEGAPPHSPDDSNTSSSSNSYLPGLSSLHLQDFKKFKDCTIPLTTSPKIILGPNGSGKTQILWSILFFLRAYNVGKKRPFKINELKSLFGDPYFDVDDGFKSFLHGKAESFTLTGTFNNPSYNYDTSTNDVKLTYTVREGLELTSDPHPTFNLPDKIRFAFMQPFYQWGTARHEENVDDLFLTSGAPHLRKRLFYPKNEALPAQFINQCLAEIGFNHINLSVKVPKSDGVYMGGPIDVKVTEGDAKLDIGACSASLQKLIAIFTMLFQLTHAEGHQQRIFLIDEPEALLYESVAGKLYRFLSTRCWKAGIQLIVATNSHSIITQNDATVVLLYLAPDGPKPITTNDKDALFSVLDALSQVRTTKRIVVVDGRNDVDFYRKFTKLGDHFELITASGMKMEHANGFVKSITGNPPFYLTDSETYALSPGLSDAEKALGKKCDSSVFLTKLPCVESYLMLSQLLGAFPIEATKFSQHHFTILEELLRALRNPDRAAYFIDLYKQQHNKAKPFGKQNKDAVSAWDSMKKTVVETRSAEENAKVYFDMVIPSNSDYLVDPAALWIEKTNSLLQIADSIIQNADNSAELAKSNATLSPEFWTTYVKLVKGHDFFENTTKTIKNTEQLHPHVQNILQQTVDAMLKA